MARTTTLKNNLLNAFGERYKTIEHNGGYLLYDKERESKRSNAYYVGRFYLSSDSKNYVFNDEYYSNVNDMVNAMEEYNKTLPFDPDIYNPFFRKHVGIELAIHDYLTDIGFKTSRSINNEYVFEDAYGYELLRITYDIVEDSSNGILIKHTTGKHTWTECPFHDLDSAIGACNSLLSSYLVLTSSMFTNILSKLTTSRASEVYDKTFDIKTLTVYTKNSKEKAIKLLEEELLRLKEEK